MGRLIISCAIAVFTLSVSAQDLDKILTDHYKASNQNKMSQITSVSIKVKVVAMGMESGVSLYQSRPNKLRVEADLIGSKMIQTYNGTTGWLYAPGMGITQPQEMGADDLKNIKIQAEIDSPLWDYEAKGKKLELTGTTEDGSAYKIKVTDTGGDDLTLCISKETALITKITATQNVNGMDTEIETELKDYKDVKGIPTAHYMVTKMGGQVVSTITFESIEYNKKLDPALFEKPAVE